MVEGSHTTGLRFRRVDLHLHTPASADFDDRTASPEAIVAAAIEKGLAAIAVTDHNSGEWIDKVKAAALGRPLVVFPGVEITCAGGRGGIHVIALLDTDCGRADVESLLSELGFQPRDYGQMTALVEKHLSDVISVIYKRGGLAVLAHANSTRGALNEMRGERKRPAIPVWCGAEDGVEGWRACATPSGSRPAPRRARPSRRAA